MTKRNKKQMSQTRKNEAFGVILIGLGVFLLLSLITYHQTDNPNLEIDNNSIEIKNLLGPTGAAIAQPLMNYTLGYPIVVLPLIILILGFKLYRHQPLLKSIQLNVSLALWSVLLSVILALPEAFETYGKMREYFPSGLIGGKIATYLVLYLGKFGTILIIIALDIGRRIIGWTLTLVALTVLLYAFFNSLISFFLKSIFPFPK